MSIERKNKILEQILFLILSLFFLRNDTLKKLFHLRKNKLSIKNKRQNSGSDFIKYPV